MKEKIAERPRIVFLGILYMLILALTLVVGFLYIRNRDQRLRNAVERELSSIAELKIEEVLRWRAGCLGDGIIVSTGISRLVPSRGFSSSGLDEATRATIVARFKAIKAAKDYNRIFLMDDVGRVMACYPEEGPPDSALSASAAGVMSSGQVDLLDFYRNAEDGRVYLSVLAPLANKGLIALRIDPYEFLYPYLAKWPTDRKTAETLLIRREGNELVSLTPLRFKEDSVLSFRLNIHEHLDLPVVRAIRGEQGIYSGKNYRGAVVLSDPRPIPGTPWFFVATMDMKEANAGSMEVRSVFLLLVLTILAGEVLAIVSASRRQKIVFYRERIRSAEALFQAEERLRKALESSNEELERRVAQRSAQLIDANEKLTVSNQELEAFAYSVAHDLREPLRAIRGYSRMLEEDHAEALDTEGRRILGVVRESADGMDRMIREILDLSRVGKMELHLHSVNMEAMARDVFRKVSASLGGANFDFRVGDLPEARADASLMERVWDNLLANAVKYSQPSPVHEVEVTGRKEAGWNVYEVRDRGVGFDPAFAHSIFNLFQRLHPPGEFEGTGIGLAIVKKIVIRHGGRVEAEGAPGKGACLRFYLPDIRAISESEDRRAPTGGES